MIDREMQNRKKQFGVVSYRHRVWSFMFDVFLERTTHRHVARALLVSGYVRSYFPSFPIARFLCGQRRFDEFGATTLDKCTKGDSSLSGKTGQAQGILGTGGGESSSGISYTGRKCGWQVDQLWQSWGDAFVSPYFFGVSSIFDCYDTGITYPRYLLHPQYHTARKQKSKQNWLL